VIHNTIKKIVPRCRPSPHSKRWWTKDLNTARSRAKRAGEKAYKYRNHLAHPSHEESRRLRNDYSELIKKTKWDFWMEWLEEVNAKSVWDANRFISAPESDGGWTRIPALKEKVNGRTLWEVQDNAEKSRMLHATFFKDPPMHEEDEGAQYPEPAFDFEPIQDEQIHRAIRRLKLYKAPGSSEVANIVLMKCADQLVPYLGPIFRATFSLRIYPESWKEFTTVVLRKPGKTDYTIPNAYRPIALLDVVAKVLSACVKEVLEYHTETLQLLPQSQFGGRPGRSAMDSIHILVNFIMDAWRWGKVVAALFLDVKSAFPSTSVKRLVHNMRMRGIPGEYTDWITCKMTGRKMVICFDDFKSEPIAVNNGLDQGCMLSMYLYNHYNAGQVDGSRGRRGEIGGGFVDDSMGAAEGATMQQAVENTTALFNRPGGPKERADTHGAVYDYDKFGYIGFSRRKRRDPRNRRKLLPEPRPDIKIGQHTIWPAKSHKFLGLIMDQELCFKEQAAHALAKGTRWVTQLRRTAKIAKGMRGEFMRAMLYGVAIPSMLYAADVWCVPPVRRANGRQTRGTKGFIGRMERVQRQAALQITGALRTTPTDLLLAHVDIAPLEFHIRKICHSAALRIATLPQTNPIGKAARRAARCHVKRLPSPLHNIMAMLKVHPDEIEKIPPIRKHPHWESAIKTVIPENKDQAEARELNNEADIRVYSDGSGYEGGVGAAAVLYRGFRPVKVLRYYLGTLDKHTVYEGECVGMMLGLELIRRETGWVLEATMGIDNQAAITATGTGKPATGSYIVDKIHASYWKVIEAQLAQTHARMGTRTQRHTRK